MAKKLRAVGLAYLELGAAEPAMGALRQAVAAQPDDASGRILLARAFYRLGHLQAALNWCLPLAEKDETALSLAVEILIDLNQPDQAMRLATSFYANRLIPEKLRFEIARAFFRLGELQAAWQTIAATKGTEGHLLRAKILAAQGREAEGEAELKKIPLEEKPAEAYLLETRILQRRGATEKVWESARKAWVIFEKDPMLRLELAEILLERRLSTEQADQLRSELEELTRSRAECAVRAWMLLGRLYDRSLQQLEPAERAYRQALAFDPENFQVRLELGHLLLRQGKAALALRLLVPALLDRPDHAEALESVAQALCQSADDEVLIRWMTVLTSALPARAPEVLARLLRAAQQAGREEAYQDSYREIHQLKNLLAVEAGRAQAEGQSYAAQKLSAIFEQTRALLQRLRHPRQELQTIVIASMLEQIVAKLGPERIGLKIHPSLPTIRADRRALEEAIVNIVSNALEFSPPGERVLVEARRARGGWLEVAISDRGPGIPLHLQERIFEPGFSTRPGGSGLGLTVARRIILQHGGGISLYSAAGGPTTFVIKLPPEKHPRGEVSYPITGD